MIDLLNTKFSQSEQGVPAGTPLWEERVPISPRRGESLFNQFRGRINRRFFICLAGALLTTTVIVYLFVINPVATVYTKAMGMGEPIGRLQAALDQGNLPLVDESLRGMEVELSELKDLYRRLGYLKAIPVARGYYGDGKHFLEAASSFVEGGRVVLESINPFSDVLGLTEGFGSYLTTEQHLAKLAEVLPQIAPQIDAALGKLFLVKTELDQIDPSRYPEEVQGVKIRFWLEEAQKILSEFEPLLTESKPIIEILPHLLGIPERTYLVLFQNDAELRATGGFITAFSVITVKDGKIVRNEFHTGAYIAARRPYMKPPDLLRRYLKVSTWYFQDGNLSPDFKVSAEQLNVMWREANLPKIGGMVAITTETGEKLLEFIGPVKLPNYSLDLTNYHQLPEDCRVGGDRFTSVNLVCRLEFYVERYGKGGVGERKAVLNELANAVIERIISSPAEVWPKLLDLVFELLSEKKLLLYATDKDEQALIEKLSYGGRIREWGGDYLHISDSNFGGLKTDMFMQEMVEQSLVRLENGRWRKTVKITYYNPQRYDNWLSANYKDFVRIYVPKGSELVRIEGANREWGSWTELGKTVFGAFFTLWPQKEHALTFVYDLPSEALAKEGPYRLLVQKQPGTNITLVKVKIGGKMRAFDLETDKEITLSLGE